MDIRLLLAIVTGKTIAALIKLTTKSGSTAAPGLYALKVDPNLIKKLTKQIKYGSILISGTNGKTTTSRLLSEILSTKFKIIHNRQGSNLLRGIASTLVKRSAISGKLREDLAIWEVDEATLPVALLHTNPKSVVLLNLFRDQLDRYGEVDSIREKWKNSLTISQSKPTLILNADDPGIAIIGEESTLNKIYFGIDDVSVSQKDSIDVTDISHCLKCQARLEYKEIYLSHLGNFHCPNCHFRRPAINLSASNIKLMNNFSSNFKIKSVKLKINLPIPGVYNIYNALAAIAASSAYSIKSETIKNKLEKFLAAFGRFQQTTIRGKTVTLFLIKNPTGANEVLKVLSQQNKGNYLIILNDNFADGTDVSWVWDTNWEYLKNKYEYLLIAGARAWDMALRLKYAGFKVSNNNVNKNIIYSINNFINFKSNNYPHYILATYTAMLQIQKYISKTGKTKWHTQ